MTPPSIRQQLHTAISIAESYKANMIVAERQYEQARDAVNTLIDKLAPLDAPNGIAKDDAPNKIALIKLVREATRRDREYLATDGELVNGSGCMGLKQAKDLVEEWLDEQGIMPRIEGQL